MANSKFTTSAIVAVNLVRTTAAPEVAIGTIEQGNDASAWAYVQFGSAVTGPGYVVVIDEAHSAVMVSTSNDALGDRIGVATVAAVSGEYGWVQTSGVCQVQVAASCAANVRLNTTATAGQIDDDATTGAFVIDGIVLTTARAASPGLAPAILTNARIGAVI